MIGKVNNGGRRVHVETQSYVGPAAYSDAEGTPKVAFVPTAGAPGVGHPIKIDGRPFAIARVATGTYCDRVRVVSLQEAKP